MFSKSNNESPLVREVVFIVIVCLGMGIPFAPSRAAQITLGQDGQTVREKVETPNLLPAGGNSLPVASSGAVPGQDPGPTPAGPVLQEKVRKVWSHLLTPAADRKDSIPSAANLDQVLQGNPTGGLEVKGTGENEGVALADGPVKIGIYMPTYKPANMEVQLFDDRGEEIFFRGRSLLNWTRPDDKAYAPVFFQGVADDASMYENGSGDFSPKKDLSYQFEIKAGQRLKIKTGGNALPESYLRVESPVL